MVVGEEFAWRKEDESGFAESASGKHWNLHIVLECKRLREGGSYVFHVTPQDASPTTRATVLWSVAPHKRDEVSADWHDTEIEPASYESSYGVIRGSDPRDKPVLDRLGSGLVAAAEAVTSEFVYANAGTTQYSGIAGTLPMIVTNARLVVAKFDPSSVGLATGTLTGGNFEEVGLIRLRKAFSTDLQGSKTTTRQAARMAPTIDPNRKRRVSDIGSRAVVFAGALACRVCGEAVVWGGPGLDLG